jgi:glutathione S-transferase
MNLIDAVAMAAVIQYLVFGSLVGRARGRYGVAAPAVSGHEAFERVYRVQMNTLELLVVFFPALYAAARYWPAWAVAAAGGVYLVGRVLYWRAYVAAPATRGLGFLLSILPVFSLALAALVPALLGKPVHP